MKPSEISEKIYIDSNVWFSYITKAKYENTFDKARNIIDGIIENKYSVAVISQLVILEMINICRAKVIQREHYKGKLKHNTSKIENLKTTIQGFIKEFVDKITKWEHTGKLQILRIELPMSVFFERVRKVQSATFGKILESNICMVCKRPYNSYKYKGADYLDIQHALIAENANVTCFVTFDKGYDTLRNHFNINFKII